MEPHQIEQHLAALDISQTDIVRDVNELKDQGNGSATLDQLDVVTSPLLTIPPELTTEIFMWCKGNGTQDKALSLSFAPFLLTRICREWRYLGMNTACLRVTAVNLTA
ncbi:hypothetical protein FB45DRAFT_1039683 [Roridomyces roridus]|uniref:F-box domain-containing protein n=1 Tax=Roridomyces roridus TaxID=1738132 RepID=A0AAD7B230_9AGAR|nr:hypothetical protein FB45DRAFT_1039683 [Roridomyces roridus]